MNDAERERFFGYLNISDGCWNWTGTESTAGYGVFSYRGRQWKVSRLARHLIYGDLDPALTIDHLCFNTLCGRPDHYEQVTRVVNSLRGSSWGGSNSRKTHCPRKHEYTSANTIRTSKGRRVCRTCEGARWQRQVEAWAARGLTRVKVAGKSRLVRCAEMHAAVAVAQAIIDAEGR